MHQFWAWWHYQQELEKIEVLETYITEWTPGLLERTARLSGVTRLTDMGDLPDKDWQTLRSFPRLKSLQMNQVTTTHDLQMLAKLKFPITSLDLRGVYLPGEGLKPLASLSSLRHVDLGSSDGLKWLVQLESLGACWSVSASDAFWDDCEKLPSLRKLEISHFDLNDHFLGRLAKLNALEELSLVASTLKNTGTNSTSRPCWAALGSMKALRKLHLKVVDIAGEDFRFLRQLTHLQDFELDSRSVLPESLVADLLSLDSLEYVTLNQYELSPGALEKLRARVTVRQTVLRW